eukprot:scaffold6506_cov112-Isochrysis_galbana.AAC.1
MGSKAEKDKRSPDSAERWESHAGAWTPAIENYRAADRVEQREVEVNEVCHLVNIKLASDRAERRKTDDSRATPAAAAETDADIACHMRATPSIAGVRVKRSAHTENSSDVTGEANEDHD